jgi:hypothetical protein
MMDVHSFRELLEPLGRELVQRTTLYGRVPQSPGGHTGWDADAVRPIAASR